MYYYEVAPTTIVRVNSMTFTYSSADELTVGQLVEVPIGTRQLVGLLIRRVNEPTYATKPITRLLDTTSVPQPLVQLSLWLSTYYQTHLANVLQTLLPRGLTKQRRSRPTMPHIPSRVRTKNVFTHDQTAVVEAITTKHSGSFLLHGVTGSGKTAVYIELATRTIASGRSVIVLVPEIALTSQLLDEFSHHFENILVTHSRHTEAQRHQAWSEALHATSPRLIIGPRSALFMPLQSIGLIVIDECHEPSFKQEQAPRYSALRAASMLARFHKARLVMGSATPLISDYYVAKETKQPILEMNTRAQAKAQTPSINLIDMTRRSSFKRHHFLSDELLHTLEKTFASGHQALIFHNRRGSASTTLCETCGWSAQCPRCFLPFTLHADRHILLCHVCGQTETVPTSCPVCGSVNIIHKGIGTKLIESELRKLFPTRTIGRFDADSEAEGSVDTRYTELYTGEIELIIGTQVIAKGLDLPKLRTVGVIQADSGLSLPDYGASERTFQLLAQVIGRVGRSHHPTTVIVQSYQPTHPAVTDGLAQDYNHFYETTLIERRRAHFPPFRYLLKLVCIYKTEASAIKNARSLATSLRSTLPNAVEVLGPTPAFYERQHDSYRWQLVLKSARRQDLLDALTLLPTTHWQFELDPISLL